MTFEWKHPKHHAKIRKDFREEIEKEKKELAECYRESRRQTEERRSTEWIKGYNKWKKDK